MPSAVVRRPHAVASPIIDWTIDQRGFGFDHVAHEAAIDLDLVEIEAVQVAQRGIAGAEIVQHHFDAACTQLMEHLRRLLVIVHQHGFGNLQLKPLGRKMGLRQDMIDLGDEAFFADLDG